MTNVCLNVSFFSLIKNVNGTKWGCGANIAALPGVTIKFNIQAECIKFNWVRSQQEVSSLVST